MDKNKKKKTLIMRNGSSKNANHKKKLIVTIFLFLGAIIFITKLVYDNSQPGKFVTVATVNGEPITYGEFRLDLAAHSSTVFTYFHKTYGVEDSKFFWTTEFEGEIPLEKAKELAINSSIRKKVQQIMGRKHGLLENISYKEFLSKLEKTNELRQEKVKKSHVIYGPITYDEQRFIDSLMISLARDLKEILIDGFNISDEDCENYYEKNKENFSLDASKTTRSIGAVFADEEDKKVNIDLVKKELNEIKRTMNSGTEFDVLYDDVFNNKNGVLSTFERIYDFNVPRTEILLNPVLFPVINNLAAGQVSDIIEDGNSIGIYKCIETHELGYKPLAAVKSDILSDLVDLRYEELVDKWVLEAKVEIIDDNMKRVEMR